MENTEINISNHEGQRSLLKFLKNNNSLDIDLVQTSMIDIFSEVKKMSEFGKFAVPVEFFTEISDLLISLRFFCEKYKNDDVVDLAEINTPIDFENSIYRANFYLKAIINMLENERCIDVFLKRAGVKISF